jgi:hypothetical protein
MIGISGQHIGSYDVSARLQLQGTAFEASAWVSSSQMFGRSPSIATLSSPSIAVAITVVDVFAAKQDALKLTDPIPASFFPMHNTPKSGATFLTLLGSGFGMCSDTPRTKLGVTQSHTLWTSDSGVQLKSPLSAIPFAGVVFESKGYSTLGRFEAVLSNFRAIDSAFSQFSSSGRQQEYWPSQFCTFALNLDLKALDEVYALARSLAIAWNSSEQEQLLLANLTVSSLERHAKLSILDAAAGHAILRSSSIISEVVHDAARSTFCGFDYLVVRLVVSEFLTVFSDSGGLYFVPKIRQLCSTTPAEQLQLSHQILKCIQPAFVPVLFSSLLSVARFFSVNQMTAADVHLGTMLGSLQVRNYP